MTELHDLVSYKNPAWAVRLRCYPTGRRVIEWCHGRERRPYDLDERAATRRQVGCTQQSIDAWWSPGGPDELGSSSLCWAGHERFGTLRLIRSVRLTSDRHDSRAKPDMRVLEAEPSHSRRRRRFTVCCAQALRFNQP